MDMLVSQDMLQHSLYLSFRQEDILQVSTQAYKRIHKSISSCIIVLGEKTIYLGKERGNDAMSFKIPADGVLIAKRPRLPGAC